MNKNTVLARDFDESFVQKMRNAVEVSHYKYGWASQNFPELVKAADCIQERLDAYRKTKNKDFLVDVANFAMFEFRYPMYAEAAYRPGDSDDSPGLAGGVSYNEMMQEVER